MCVKLLGRYDNFPTNIHGIARFTCPTSTRILQKTITRTLRTLNKQTIELKKLTKASPTNCIVNFEFGVADADTFSFLDEEELKKIEKALEKQAFPILDVFCAARYHILEASEKRKSLKFDYNMLRFTFYGKDMELFVYHERGIQRIPAEDLILFLENQINQQLIEKHQEKLTLKHIHAL